MLVWYWRKLILAPAKAATQREFLLFLLAVFHTFTGLRGASIHLFGGVAGGRSHMGQSC